MKISKFINNPEDKPFHTSGYAEAANKGSMGSTSTQSFIQRKRIDQNRRAIRKYRESHIGRTYASNRVQSRVDVAKPAGPGLPASSRQQRNAPSSSARPTASQPMLPPGPIFKEPPKRGFNPFS